MDYREINRQEDLRFVADCFHDPDGTLWSEPGTYADAEAETKVNSSIEFRHPVSDLIGALLERGLTLEPFHEFDHSAFARWPFMHRASDGTYRVADDRPRMPLPYSLRLRKSRDLQGS